LTVGGPRYVALALLAPLFGMPASLAAPVVAAPTAGAAVHVRHEAVRVAADGSVRSAGLTSARRDAGSSRAHYTGQLKAPRRVHLLAARLYWGPRHPSSPSASQVHHDLRRVADWYAHVSRGREHVRVTVTRWVRVRASGSAMCDTEGRSIHAANAGLRRAGYHPGRFNRLMIFTEQCDSAASAAQLPGRVSWVRFRAPGVPTLVHELGHNLGLEHAYGVVCRRQMADQLVPQRVALGRATQGVSCTAVEYGDSWDAMGHSSGFFSAAALTRLGWAGKIKDVSTSGQYVVADVEHSGTTYNQALRIRAGTTTYWVEYQPEHSPLVGRTIPGVMIRREVGSGPVEIVDAAPGNPAGIPFPDRDLTNPALPVGSSLTTPEDIRITTLSTGRRASVQVTFGAPAGVPDAPVVTSAVQDAAGYDVRWQAPADNGQIVLGYQVTASPSGATTFVRGPAGYRTSAHLPLGDGQPQTFTVRALNQDGLSLESVGLPAVVSGSTP
jgi:hypothetical protein